MLGIRSSLCTSIPSKDLVRVHPDQRAMKFVVFIIYSFASFRSEEAPLPHIRDDLLTVPKYRDDLYNEVRRRGNRCIVLSCVVLPA